MIKKFITESTINKDRVLLIDFANLSIRNLFAVKYDPLDENYTVWKNMIIRSLRKLFLAFDPGRVIFCLEGRNNWRKDVYPEYKAQRKLARDTSHIDFDTFFPVQNDFIEVLKNLLTNCCFLQVEGAEADDLIGCITKNNPKWNIINISTDRDFFQLYKFNNYRQYDPIKNKFIEVVEPKNYLLEKVILGDMGDNIPNIRAGIGPKTAAKIVNCKEGLDEWLKIQNLEAEFNRNLTLIDFEFIPEEVQNEINKALKEYKITKFDPRALMDFFTKNDLTAFISDITLLANLFSKFDISVEECK